VATVQYTFTHKQYTEYREGDIHNNNNNKIGKCEPCPVFAIPWHFTLELRKKHGQTSVRVVKECPDVLMAVVQYTFTHKKYTTRDRIHRTEHT
jgi:hypothetical protein